MSQETPIAPLPPWTGAAAAAAAVLAATSDQVSQPVVVMEAAVERKCCFRGCPVRGADLHTCAVNSCKKEGHLMCYQKHVLGRHKLEPLSGGRIACTKKCYEKAMKSSVGADANADETRKGNWM